MEIQFIQTHKDAKLPQKNNSDHLRGDAGYDLFTVEDCVIPAKGSAIVPVGLKLGFITPGYWFRIEPRSGLGFKQSLQPHLGVIDNGYRGDLGIKVYNFSDDSQLISKGNGVAQFVVYQMIPSTVSFTDVAKEGLRGESGFGSSDKN